MFRGILITEMYDLLKEGFHNNSYDKRDDNNLDFLNHGDKNENDSNNDTKKN